MQVPDVYRSVRKRPAPKCAQAESLHLLGVLASESGQHQLGAVLILKAIKLGGPLAPFCCSLAVNLLRQGNADGAAACYRQAICADPDHADAHWNLGNILHGLRRFQEAEASYRKAIALDPRHARAHYNLGVTLMLQGRVEEAAACCREAIRHQPDYPEAHNNLGTLLHALDRVEESLPHFRKAIELDPGYNDARYNLGSALHHLDREEEAASLLCQVLKSSPGHVQAQNNLANALVALGQPQEAVTLYRSVLNSSPQNRDAHWNLGLAHLLLGRFDAGWDGYETRAGQSWSARPELAGARWDGSPLEGRRILLHAEQGFGDTVQFVRYAPLVKRRGGVVILECHPELAHLFNGLEGIHTLVPRGQPLPEFDCHLPLLSLPRVFATTLESIPAGAPYLHADPELVEKWNLRVRAGRPDGLRVGLVWGGNPGHRNDRNRSLSCGELEALAGIPNTAFFCLQKADRSREARELDDTLDLIHVEEELADFAETAAAISTLDLVISVDTAVAHLAGALGSPVWTLLPFAPDWRWMLDRQDSPWYPTMRLFRQPARKQWKPVLENLRSELMKLQGSGM